MTAVPPLPPTYPRPPSSGTVKVLGTLTYLTHSSRGRATLLCTVFVMTPPMNTPVREGETIEGSRTMRNRPYPVLKCSRARMGRRAGLVGHRLARRVNLLDDNHLCAEARIPRPKLGLLPDER